MTKIAVLPNNGFAPSNDGIAKHLREQAQWIEESDTPIRNVYVIVETCDGEVYRNTCGEPCDLARAIGVIQTSLIRSVMGNS